MLTRKISRMVLVLALLASTGVTGFVGLREFSIALDRLVESSVALVRGRPTLPVLIFEQDRDRLRNYLANFLSSNPVRYAALFNLTGKLLLEEHRRGEPPYPIASYSALRANLDPVEPGRQQRALASSPSGEGGERERFGASYLRRFGEQVTDITIPVFSMVNPLETAISRTSYAIAVMENRDVQSQYVVGFVNVGISHSYLWWEIGPRVLGTLLSCILLSIACMIVAWIYGQRISGPLAGLASLAEKVAAGNVDSDVRFRAGGEAGQIADMLNTIMSELKTHKTHMNVHHKLLSLKVEERDVQLSERSQELDKAVSEVSRTREDLQRMAYFDSLTGLPNRRLFTEQLNLLLRLSSRNSGMLALLFLDLDNFKRINDTLGHSAGDLLLREVGIRISNSMRESDLAAHYAGADTSVRVSRLGGDEFTVVLNHIDRPESAALVAQRVLDAMASPMLIDGHELVVTPSIGIAISPQDAEDLEGLLKAADTAMYCAKSSGKSNYMFYSREMDTSNVERLKMETELRFAIERKELVLHYQPQVDVESGSVVGVEALIRWNHPEFGLISPKRFIPIAEDSGLIVSLSDWALGEACHCIKTLRDNGWERAKVAVNVSAMAFSSALVGRVQSAIDDSGIAPGSLELELTEGVMMDSTSTSVESLEKMKAMGVSLSIDDFGTGYSSLSYLSHFPLDTLKIDRSFVIDFDKSENNASLLTAIIAMARSLNLRIVAEGVEDVAQLRFLRANGVDIIQGFLFSKAVPEDQLTALLHAGNFLPQIQNFANDYRAIKRG